MRPEIKQRIVQIQRGEVPKGYTKKKQILIPSRWDYLQIQDVAKVSSGSTPNRKNPAYWNGSMAWVTTGELSNGHIYHTLESITENAIAESNLRVYPKGTLLMAMYGQGKTRGTVAILEIDATINQACAAILTETKNIMFLFYQLQNSYDDIRKLSNTGNQENLNADIIKSYRILWAPDDEQQKIATILMTQDKIIELKEKLLAEKQQQKKYLMQQLLTGKKRLPGFSDKWRKVRLHQIVERLTRRNTVGNRNVLTISAQFGLINQGEFFNKTVASDDKSNYFLLEKGDFAYNKSYSNGYPFGAIKRLSLYDNGIVSPLYICFHMLDNKNSAIYLEQYFEAGLMNREIQAFAQEGARNHGLLNISVEDFFNSKIQVPTLEEQTAIAEVLSTADHEIDLLQKDIEQEKQKKKALMQLLLTGIVRV